MAQGDVPATGVEIADTALSPGAGSGGERDASAWVGTQIDRFTVVDQLGVGGMGVVLAAHDPRLDRKVALKLVRGDDLAAGGRARLLREGAAMARLNHPNVLTVHEAGTVGDDVFLVMELVEGRTLRAWLAECTRSWREIVEVFVAIGHGLVAAHAAGLIHRDLKPDNVLVGNDGRVRVMDFGLAAQAGEVIDGAVRRGSILEVDLTQTGSIMGTPLYMAPEQHLAEDVDARADQWAFCASLYEALGKRPPYGGKTLDAVRDAVLSRPPRELGPGVPAGVRRIILRGLARDPAARYPSMAALLVELTAVGVRRRRIAIAAAAVAIAAAGGGAVYAFAGESQPDRCATAAAPVDAVYSPAAREQLRAALAGIPRGDAAATAARATGLLDDRVASWRTTRVAACRATWDRGTQSPVVLERRARCLDQSLDKLRVLLAVLSDRPDADMLDHAVELASDQLAVDRCANDASVGGDYPLPEDPDRRRLIDTLDGRLETASVLTDTGKLDAAEAIMQPLLVEARAAQYPPLLARVLSNQATLADHRGDNATAVVAAREAIEQAAVAHAYRDEAEYWIVLINQVVATEGPEKAMELIAPASIAVKRIGDPPEIHALLLLNLSVLYQRLGELDDALALVGLAYGLQVISLPPDHYQFVFTLGQLGELTRVNGDPVRALAVKREALAVAERAFGTGNPRTIATLGGIGLMQRALGDYTGAIETASEAVRRAEITHGSDGEKTLAQTGMLAAAHAESGDFDAARPIFARTIGGLDRLSDKLSLYSALHNQCQDWLRPGEAALAAEIAPICRRAFDLAIELHGAKSHMVAVEHAALGDVALSLGKAADAEKQFQLGRDLLVENFGDEHPYVPVLLNGLGRALASQGKFREAIAIAEKNQAIVERSAPEPRWAIDGRFTLAQMRWDAGDKAAAIADANLALAGATEHHYDEMRDAIAAWIAAHPVRGRGKPR